MSFYQHPSAIVDDGARIGDGSRIWHFVHVCAGARIGADVSLGQNVFVGNEVIIGDHCKIQNNVSVYDNVTLEEHVFCGPSMVFTNVYNPRAHIARKDEYLDPLVKRGATLDCELRHEGLDGPLWLKGTVQKIWPAEDGDGLIAAVEFGHMTMKDCIELARLLSLELHQRQAPPMRTQEEIRRLPLCDRARGALMATAPLAGPSSSHRRRSIRCGPI